MVVAEPMLTSEREASSPAKRSRRRRATAWPTPAHFRQSIPIIRLLAEIWAVPQVSTVGLTSDGLEIHVWVIMPDEDREAETAIILAEREYLQATEPHNFVLDVVPLTRVRPSAIPPFETVLER